MFSNKSIIHTKQASDGKARQLLKIIARKVVILAVVAVVFGWFFSWASPWAFPPQRTVGFGFGLLHGAMMPLALPSLVTGQNVRIYDDNNAGRPYKIGYICGVNICGLIFIGPLFWRPRPVTSTSSDKSG
jgi:hypothetical protein